VTVAEAARHCFSRSPPQLRGPYQGWSRSNYPFFTYNFFTADTLRCAVTLTFNPLTVNVWSKGSEVHRLWRDQILAKSNNSRLNYGDFKDWNSGAHLHFCFLLYLLRKWSYLHRNFSKYGWVNSAFSCSKITELVNKYFLVSVTQFWHHVDLFCNSGINTVGDRYLPMPTSTTLKVLHLAKKKSHILTAAKCGPTTYFWL